ncbi:hypothetical protein [Streptomyces sp. NPDC055287]
MAESGRGIVPLGFKGNLQRVRAVVVEGHVNRIRMLKHQMFGRADFAPLRKRVLLA